MPGSQFYTDSFFHIDSLGFNDMGKMLSGFPFIPPAVIMIVLIIFSPVPMKTSIQPGEGREDFRNLFRIGHIIIRLPLIKIINPGFVHFFIGMLVVVPSSPRGDIGMPIRFGQIKIASL